MQRGLSAFTATSSWGALCLLSGILQTGLVSTHLTSSQGTGHMDAVTNDDWTQQTLRSCDHSISACVTR